MEGGALSYDWDALVPRIVHPLKIAIIEALRRVGKPLSAADLAKIVDDERFGLPRVFYHLIRLADAGAIRIVESQVPGPVKKLYSIDSPK